ncbi:MAG: hypothetical protein U0K36_01170 [Bacteroidales bacterium]|nr:hypothetical protein [Bacteroidales bacterium]
MIILNSGNALKIAAAALGVSLLSACGNTSSNNNQFDEIPDSLQGAPLQLSENVVNDMIQNISSPVEMANQILKSGAAFDKSVLNDAEKMKDYNTSFKRSLNLGAYSADLGYINTFNKNSVVVSYLLAVKELADGLNVGQFLDFSTLSRLAKNSTNLDSLKQLSVSSFNEMDKYLREQKRSNVSTAIVAGAWVEGIFITCKVIEQTQDPELINRLGEQKDIVGILLIILNNYSRGDVNFQELVSKVDDVKKIYDDVQITYELGEPVTKEVDGMLVIEQNELTHVKITPEQVSAIIAKVNDLRQFIVE